MERATLPAEGQIREESRVPRDVRAIPPPVKTGSNEPPVRAGGGLIDPADAGSPHRATLGAFHFRLYRWRMPQENAVSDGD
jgi:hypothetical protein